MFYDIFNELCKLKGVSDNRACIEIGLSRTAVAKWKSGGTPNGVSAAKIANYFGVSTDYLLGKEKSPSSDELDRQLGDMEFALFGEVKEMTDGEKQDILDYIRFKKAQKEGKK